MSDIPKSDTPKYKRRGKDPYVTVRITEDQRALLHDLARELGGVTVSDSVRWLIRQLETGRIAVPQLQHTGT